jgi:hypothetical protein
MHYLPMHKYEQTVSQQMKSILSFSGNDSLLNILKEKGVANPMIINRKTDANALVTTGEYNNTTQQMPIELIFKEVKDGNGNTIIPNGAGFIGTVKQNSLPDVDSLILPDKKDSITRMALLQLKNLFQQIHLPEAKMKVGDEYKYTTPLTIPLSGITMKAEILITYRLMTVTDSLANFNMLMKVNFDFNMSGVTVKSAYGSGTGNLIYDRINDYPLKETIDYNIKMATEKNGITINVSLDSHSLHSYVITKI